MLSRLRSLRHLSRFLGSAPCRQLHEYFQYTRAIFGSVNEHYPKYAGRFKEPEHPIDIKKAEEQHSEYMEQMKKLLPGEVVQTADNRFPDQIFVQDPAAVYDGIALLARSNSAVRAGEKEVIRQALEELGFKDILEMKHPESFLDGGDVIFTGREFLIGLSSRTNKAGVEEFARVFSKWPVTAIQVKQGPTVFHLTSMSSMCGIDTIAISDTEAGRLAWKEITQKAHYTYRRLAFPDDNGANCLFVNGIVLHPSKEDYPESYKVWETLECEKIPLPNSEFTKSDASLTCRSILIN